VEENLIVADLSSNEIFCQIGNLLLASNLTFHIFHSRKSNENEVFLYLLKCKVIAFYLFAKPLSPVLKTPVYEIMKII
jgi:hypothetical protein